MFLRPRVLLRRGINRIRAFVGARPLAESSSVKTELGQAGQIVVIFALMLTALIGMLGIAIDSTFAWRESLRVQRSADAASLAGVVYLPGNFNGATPSATSTALAEAAMDGYTVSTTTTVTPSRATNPYELDVTISSQIPTFFSRIFGINTFTISRTSKAVFVLPVPMGSPENYYGSFGSYKVNNTPVALTGPGGEAMTARGYWGSILSQGADISNGDAYQPKYNGAGANPNPQDTVDYYNYAVYMPPGATNGKVWIFDPGFCDTDSVQGTGEFWLGGSGAMSTFYELYNTNDQPYNLGLQTFLGSSGNLFANESYSDSTEGGSGGSSCRNIASTANGEHWHDGWWELTGPQGANQMITGGASGTTYRVHVTTDPGDSSQDSVNGLNNYAIFASATGGSPMVYGIGAMQMYTPLPANQTSVFYLAQISQQAGAGKTVQIQLWDPGDTGNLTANLSILAPTAAGWSPATMSWTAQKVATSGASCNSLSGSGTAVMTSNAGNHLYNGCWLTISIPIPIGYTADQNGWWKIQYAMTGSGAASTDETTWQVNIRGNPVHLV